MKQHVSNLRGKLREHGWYALVQTTKDGKRYYLTHRVTLKSDDDTGVAV
jgi:hypothetical protein